VPDGRADVAGSPPRLAVGDVARPRGSFFPALFAWGIDGAWCARVQRVCARNGGRCRRNKRCHKGGDRFAAAPAAHTRRTPPKFRPAVLQWAAHTLLSMSGTNTRQWAGGQPLKALHRLPEHSPKISIFVKDEV